MNDTWRIMSGWKLENGQHQPIGEELQFAVSRRKTRSAPLSLYTTPFFIAGHHLSLLHSLFAVRILLRSNRFRVLHPCFDFGTFLSSQYCLFNFFGFWCFLRFVCLDVGEWEGMESLGYFFPAFSLSFLLVFCEVRMERHCFVFCNVEMWRFVGSFYEFLFGSRERKRKCWKWLEKRIRKNEENRRKSFCCQASFSNFCSCPLVFWVFWWSSLIITLFKEFFSVFESFFWKKLE